MLLCFRSNLSLRLTVSAVVFSHGESMRGFRLTVEYDGTDFVGWQSQQNGRAVQDEILKALHQVLGEEITLIGAGRTDSGVHARGQVAGFRTEKTIEPGKLLTALNGLLSEDVRVLSVKDAPASFHARFDARQRRYSYHISLKPSALDRRTCWYVRYHLDVPMMVAAAKQILGKHDFSAFCKHEAEVDNRVCTVMLSEWNATEDRLVYSIAADRFIHGMVRALVGTMVDIGRGYTPLEKVSDIMASRNRSAAGTAAPAKGLCLEEVVY